MIYSSTFSKFFFVVIFCFSASASIIDDVAIVTVGSLQCEGTYSITAGGIIDSTLDGPRFHTETVIAGACPVIPSTTSLCKKIYVNAVFCLEAMCIHNLCTLFIYNF